MSRFGKIEASRPEVEISLTAEEASAARRLLLRLLEVDLSSGSTSTLHEIACRIREARHERRSFFPTDLFADPGWDMVLALYCAEGRGEQLSVTALGHSVGLAQTTALRWINMLAEAGFVERHPDERDRRRHFLRLTEPASDKITSWLIRVGSRLGSPLDAASR